LASGYCFRGNLALSCFVRPFLHRFFLFLFLNVNFEGRDWADAKRSDDWSPLAGRFECMDLSDELEQSLCGAPIIRICQPPPVFLLEKYSSARVIATGVVTFPRCFPAPKFKLSNELWSVIELRKCKKSNFRMKFFFNPVC
jgi:hypothetical protein